MIGSVVMPFVLEAMFWEKKSPERVVPPGQRSKECLLVFTKPPGAFGTKETVLFQKGAWGSVNLSIYHLSSVCLRSSSVFITAIPWSEQIYYIEH
jgi:hypothetical protein